MSNRIVMAAILAGLLAGGATGGAQAQQPASSAPPAVNSSGWSFDITPYGWFATINSNMSFNLPPALGGTVTAGSSVGFGELLSHLNFATMLAADVQYDRFSILTDFLQRNPGRNKFQV